MKIKVAFVTLLLFSSFQINAQDKAPYRIYNSKGKKVKYKKLLKEVQQKDIILFGEFHDNPIAHWMQLELSKDLHKTAAKLTLGAEMIERDNQDELDDYLAGTIDQIGLDTLARLWGNHKTDYAPLVDFAKDKKLKFIATNIPRKLASLVFHGGGFGALDNLSPEEKNWVAPLPIVFDPELPQYKNILDMMPGHATPDLVKAQAIKDATMAYSILENHQKGEQFLHFNGAYHSDFYEGILWYLKNNQPELSYGTITTVLQEDINTLDSEHLNRADFIICVDEDMTRTY